MGFNASINMVRETCWTCDLVWYMTDTFIKLRKSDGKSFYCPAGHSLRYGETEAERLTKELKSAHDLAATRYRDWDRAFRQLRRTKTLLRKCEKRRKR